MKFSDLVDIGILGELCDSFSSITGAVTAILDLEGDILTATGWQDICTRFHRVHPATARRCRVSDTVLAGRLGKGDRYNVYKCRNGLIDVAVPITIGGEHVANFFTGQFFFEPPDKEFYIRQAEKFGFDKDSYIEALAKVPIFSEDKVRSMMAFFTRLAKLIGEMGLARKNQDEANAELRRHQERLEELVMERTVELSRANGELQAEIAERQRADEALRESEERYRSLIELAPDAIIIHQDGRLIFANAAALKLYGAAKFEQLQGRPVFELIHPDERDAVQARMIRVRGGGEVPVREFRMLRLDGREVPVEATGIRIDYLGRPAVHAIFRDITARKKAEEARRKSEKKFLTVFHAVPALLGITTLAEGRFIDVNEMCMRVLGYQREEMIGRTSLELELWGTREERERVMRALEEQGTVREIEVNLRGKTGERFVGLLSAEFIDIDGEQFVLTMINDITERKRAETEIAILNTDLADRARELEAANRELETFNYSVSHDLRNPLTVINGYCQAIRELCSDKLDEQCRQYLGEAYEGTLRMNRLIDTLLNFSRLTHIKPHREPVDLSSMAQAAAAELQRADPSRRVSFLIADGIGVEGDAGLLRVVLDNLLGNAWKFTGGREEGIIEFGTAEVGGKLAYFVRDNGIGFDMADADNLFIPFRRLPGAEESKGFGIGLATVERIVQRHGGRVWAEGAPGKGATFYFTLPGRTNDSQSGSRGLSPAGRSVASCGEE